MLQIVMRRGFHRPMSAHLAATGRTARPACTDAPNTRARFSTSPAPCPSDIQLEPASSTNATSPIRQQKDSS